MREYNLAMSNSRHGYDNADPGPSCSGCDPLTPEDIAEVVVFVASRRQNVVVADTLIFPSHQVGQLRESLSPPSHTDRSTGRRWCDASQGVSHEVLSWGIGGWELGDLLTRILL